MQMEPAVLLTSSFLVWSKSSEYLCHFWRSTALSFGSVYHHTKKMQQCDTSGSLPAAELRISEEHHHHHHPAHTFLRSHPPGGPQWEDVEQDFQVQTLHVKGANANFSALLIHVFMAFSWGYGISGGLDAFVFSPHRTLVSGWIRNTTRGNYRLSSN